ncbi:MAG: hypothetical protein K0S76_1796 [Herbinix sp.]|jgi:hypothetical protein|nr:hypothetical protein [Herbinix sp.]
MNCVKCNAILNDGAKFCVKCGEKVVLKKYCQSCKAEIGNGDVFCAECGNPIVPPKTNTSIASPKIFKTHVISRLTKAQSEKLSEDEKKVIIKLKKDAGFILYDNERNFVFMQRDNWSYIEVITPSAQKKPVDRFTLPTEFAKLKHGMDRTHYLFYTNADALIIWDDYIFVSIYNGQICWSAADSRDERRLPGGKANECIMCSGAPELELLPNGRLKAAFQGAPVEYRIEQGVLIPCN